MKLTKWIEVSQEVEISMGLEDVRAALGESFADYKAGTERRGEDGYMAGFLSCLNSIAQFLNAVTDEQIAALNLSQKKTISGFLLRAAGKFSPKNGDKP
jgi:hypothetical protein